MRREDVARVMEIAAGLADAPKWPEAAYLAALEPDGLRRIALVALGAEAWRGLPWPAWWARRRSWSRLA